MKRYEFPLGSSIQAHGKMEKYGCSEVSDHFVAQNRVLLRFLTIEDPIPIQVLEMYAGQQNRVVWWEAYQYWETKVQWHLLGDSFRFLVPWSWGTVSTYLPAAQSLLNIYKDSVQNVHISTKEKHLQCISHFFQPISWIKQKLARLKNLYSNVQLTRSIWQKRTEDLPEDFIEIQWGFSYSS